MYSTCKFWLVIIFIFFENQFQALYFYSPRPPGLPTVQTAIMELVRFLIHYMNSFNYHPACVLCSLIFLLQFHSFSSPPRRTSQIDNHFHCKLNRKACHSGKFLCKPKFVQTQLLQLPLFTSLHLSSPSTLLSGSDGSYLHAGGVGGCRWKGGGGQALLHPICFSTT